MNDDASEKLRQLCAKAANEYNSGKLQALAAEIIRLLDEKELRLKKSQGDGDGPATRGLTQD